MHLSSEFLGVMSHPIMNDFWEQKKRYLLTNLYELIVGELKRLRQSVRRNLHVIAGGDVVESKHIELMQQCQEYVSEVERKSEGALSQWQEHYRLFHGLTTVIEQQYPSSHWLFEVMEQRQNLVMSDLVAG